VVHVHFMSSVNGWVVLPIRQTKISSFPQLQTLAAKKDKKNNVPDDEEGEQKGRVGRFFSKIFSEEDTDNTKSKEKVEKQDGENSAVRFFKKRFSRDKEEIEIEKKEDSDGAVVRFVKRRFSKDKEDGDKAKNQGDSSKGPILPFGNFKNEIDLRNAIAKRLEGKEKDLEVLDQEDLDIPKLTEAWDSLEEKVLVVRSAINSIKESRKNTEDGGNKEVLGAEAEAIDREAQLVERAARERERQLERLRKNDAEKEDEETNEDGVEEIVEKKDSGKTPASVAQKLFGKMFSNDEEWVVVFPKTRIDPGEIVPVSIGGIDLLVVAARDGEKLYCLENSCSHLGTPLETGLVEQRPAIDKKRTFPISKEPTMEDCIVCPTHKTAFALDSGEVRGAWCPYPPVLGKMMGNVKNPAPVTVFEIRAKGKNIEARINSPFRPEDIEKKDKEKS